MGQMMGEAGGGAGASASPSLGQIGQALQQSGGQQKGIQPTGDPGVPYRDLYAQMMNYLGNLS